MTVYTIKNGIIALLLVVVLLLCGTIVHIENERYALLIGTCPNVKTTSQDGFIYRDPNRDPIACLESVQTRTSPLWHIFYAIENTYR